MYRDRNRIQAPLDPPEDAGLCVDCGDDCPIDQERCGDCERDLEDYLADCLYDEMRDDDDWRE